MNIPLSGLMLKKKALAYATSLGHQDFKASDGWLGNFKKRYEICGKSVYGKSGSVNDDVCEDWISKLSSLVQDYTPYEIYNADETALFYRCLPNKTSEFKNKPYHGGKESKERLTVLLAAT